MPKLSSIAICLCLLQQGATAFTQPSIHVQNTATTRRTTSASSFSALQLDLPQLSFPNLFESKDTKRTELKQKILALAASTNRGLTATDEQKKQMYQLFEQLENLNPTSNPLTKPTVNGDWSLDYTTSDSILGKGGFPRVGPIIQNIDTTTLSAKNSELVKYFYLFDVPRSVTAELSPVSSELTDVKFKRFTLGPVGFDAPESFRGSLDITYLDEEVRLTRGDKGNIFVLTRM